MSLHCAVPQWLQTNQHSIALKYLSRPIKYIKHIPYNKQTNYSFSHSLAKAASQQFLVCYIRGSSTISTCQAKSIFETHIYSTDDRNNKYNFIYTVHTGSFFQIQCKGAMHIRDVLCVPSSISHIQVYDVAAHTNVPFSYPKHIITFDVFMTSYKFLSFSRWVLVDHLFLYSRNASSTQRKRLHLFGGCRLFDFIYKLYKPRQHIYRYIRKYMKEFLYK